jgi:hypothetical protein
MDLDDAAIRDLERSEAYSDSENETIRKLIVERI